MKECIKCNKTYLEENFHKDKRTKDGCCSYCKQCAKAIVLQWRKDNPNKVQINRRKYYSSAKSKIMESHKRYRATPIGKAKQKVYARRTILKTKYNMTEKQYVEMQESQNFRCKICERGFTDLLKPKIDHCHKTGEVRGLLCNTCNTGLGHIEKEGFLNKALVYLRKV